MTIRAVGSSTDDRLVPAADGSSWIASVVPISELGQSSSAPDAPRYTTCLSKRTQVRGCWLRLTTFQERGTWKWYPA